MSKLTKEDIDKRYCFYDQVFLDKLFEKSTQLGVRYDALLKKCVKWESVLVKNKIEYDIFSFLSCVDHPSFGKSRHQLTINFYEYNYSSLDYVKIYEANAKRIMDNRGSPYDPHNIAKKHNVSIEEAIEISKERKNRTSGTIENFIRRHGEVEGRKKFEEFKNKSKSTIENFKKRFGDDWEIRWNHFLSTRDSSSLKYWVGKLGEEAGKKKFAELQKSSGKSSKIEYYIEKYGEIEGTKKYKEIMSKKSVIIEDMIEKGMSEEDINTLRMKKSSIFVELKKIYGYEEAVKKYLEYKETKVSPVILKNGKYLRNKKTSCVSKQSVNFFSSLEVELGRELKYGKKSEELKLFDKNSNRLYYYDCYDELSNTIIEFNGVAFHADPRVSVEERDDWVTTFGRTWHDAKNIDDLKINFAKESGYNVIVVWSFEIIGKKRLIKKNLELKEILNENKVN